MNKQIILAIIVFSQFAGVSLWFLPNAFLAQLHFPGDRESGAISLLTAMVQFGFIAGTFCFALVSLADRMSPSRLFFYCTIIAGGCNLALLLFTANSPFFLGLRFLIGFFLAGIYPVGMKIAADHFEQGISKALGLLVGALVLGTALPHLLAGLSITTSWSTVVLITTALAVSGGLLVFLLVPDGPFRGRGSGFDPRLMAGVFKNKPLRQAAFGYFGHMWELYAFWAFIPVLIATLAVRSADFSIREASFISFAVIAIGSLSCIVGGYMSTREKQRVPSAAVARVALIVSGACCLLSPLAFALPMALVVLFLALWGAAVIMDSPQFSSLVASSTIPEHRGTAITIVTCIGFGISTISIAFLGVVVGHVGIEWAFLFLVPGPILGLIGMGK